jgi:hypothetical protein
VARTLTVKAPATTGTVIGPPSTVVGSLVSGMLVGISCQMSWPSGGVELSGYSKRPLTVTSWAMM